MKRIVIAVLGATLVLGTAGFTIADAQQRGGVVFGGGDGPVGQDQVRAQLQTDGWSDIKIVVNGQYFEVSGTKAGAPAKLVVDSETGKLAATDDDDDD